MKNQMRNSSLIALVRIMTFAMLFLFSGISNLFPQAFTTVSGRLIDQKDQSPLPYTNVVLTDSTGGTMITGTSSDTGGVFILKQVAPGEYRLKVSLMGYQTYSRGITIKNNQDFDAGTIRLQETVTGLQEVTITGIRSKGKAGAEKTTFYMTRKMCDASRTGIDVMRQIPGVQVDLLQNISLEGNRNILILIDGRESDKGFVSRINPSEIDRIEVMSAPPSRYDADVTGVINIILKKERPAGISGQINLEVPTGTTVIYSRPSANISLGFRKARISASYTGEMIYGNLHDRTIRRFMTQGITVATVADQQVRQKYGSHRVDLDFDYQFAGHDRLNIRGFYDPTSRSLNGAVITSTTGAETPDMTSRQESCDRNTNLFASLFYSHKFNDKGGEISTDISGYCLRGETSTSFTTDGPMQPAGEIKTAGQPGQHALNVKLDYNVPVAKGWNLSAGAKGRWLRMWDELVPEFIHRERIHAFYGSAGYAGTKWDASLGLRLEDSQTETEMQFSSHNLALLPQASVNLRLTSGQQLRFSAGRSVQRPAIWQLNPMATLNDPFTVSRGNPSLKPEYRTTVWMEYSKKFPSDFFSLRLFYDHHSNVINTLTQQGDSTMFTITWSNLGTIRQAGLQALGSFSIGKSVNVSPFLKVYRRWTTGNDLARYHQIENREQWVFEPGLSAVFSFRHEMTLSVIIQYASPKNNMQGNYFSGPLYFLHFDKTFKKGWKAGLVCGLPLTKQFNYNGSLIDGSGFRSEYSGDLQVPGMLLNLTLSYRFGSGKQHSPVAGTPEEPDMSQKKVF